MTNILGQKYLIKMSKLFGTGSIFQMMYIYEPKVNGVKVKINIIFPLCYDVVPDACICNWNTCFIWETG